MQNYQHFAAFYDTLMGDRKRATDQLLGFY